MPVLLTGTVVRKGNKKGSSSSSALKRSCFAHSTRKMETKVLKQKPEGQFVKEESDVAGIRSSMCGICWPLSFSCSFSFCLSSWGFPDLSLLLTLRFFMSSEYT